MTIFEFLMQSPKQIQETFRSKDWFDTYHKVPRDVPSWCRCFDLDPDPRVDSFWGDYFYIKDKVSDWFGDIEVKVEFSITGRNHKIVTHFLGFGGYCTSGGPEIGRDKYLPGHSEKEKDSTYYHLAYDIPQTIIADSYERYDGYPGITYKYSDKTPVGDYFKKMIDFCREFEPMYKAVYDSYYDGSFKKLWKKYYTRECRKGDMTNSGFGVGLRGLANLMYYGKHFLDLDVSLEDALAMSHSEYKHDMFGFSGGEEKRTKEEKIIGSIMFWNRNGYFDDYSWLTKEKYQEIIKKYRK